MTDTPELDVVERLRERAAAYSFHGPAGMAHFQTVPDTLCQEAAGTITSLRAQLRDAREKAWDDASAEIERKISALKQWQSLLPRDSSVIDKLQARVEILEDVALTFRARAQQQIGAEEGGMR